jgi:hypothetical protein
MIASFCFVYNEAESSCGRLTARLTVKNKIRVDPCVSKPFFTNEYIKCDVRQIELVCET